MPPSAPKALAKAQISFMFDPPLEGLSEQDIGKMFVKIEFKGMVNGGYTVKGEFIDPHFNILNRLIDSGYFKTSRTKPVAVIFQLRWGPQHEAHFPETATKKQVAYLLSLKSTGNRSSDSGYIEFVAMDPPSWFLNMGDGNGGVYNGRVSDAIEQVVTEYAPKVKLQIGKTIDSAHGKWWMMRQDPRTFISSLFDWSASITQQQTQWIFAPDGYELVIKEQAKLISEQRGFYRYMEQNQHDTIHDWEFLADNALSSVQTQLITQGISAISGQYLDRITDTDKKKVFIYDERTPHKRIAKIKADQGFTKPSAEEPLSWGSSSIATIPEIYSAGDLGLSYDQYIDGRPRAMWLNLVNALMRVKIECIGHGEWSSCKGLGIDTVFIKWTSAQSGTAHKPFWWMTGNWLVYGFHHRLVRGFWYTDLYLARFDHDAKAVKVGGNKSQQ